MSFFAPGSRSEFRTEVSRSSQMLWDTVPTRPSTMGQSRLTTGLISYSSLRAINLWVLDLCGA
jgi:hypothetical protein